MVHFPKLSDFGIKRFVSLIQVVIPNEDVSESATHHFNVYNNPAVQRAVSTAQHAHLWLRKASKPESDTGQPFIGAVIRLDSH